MRRSKKSLALFLMITVVVVFTSGLWAAEAEKVNINKASVEEISKLEKIGPKYAERIVQYRKDYGPFEKPEDITRVKGIGPKTYELNKDKISVK